MASESGPPTAEEVQDLVRPEVVRALQIIHLAMPLGALGFGGIVAWKALSGGQNPQAEESARLLSLVHPVFGFVMYVAAIVVPPRMRSAGTGAVRVLDSIRGAAILRLAMLEGIAMLGLVTCFLAAEAGVLRDRPIYWANTLSTLVLLAYVAARFPTRDRIVSAFLSRVGGGPFDLR